tara:strand:- start:1554 stop:2318 length:765 start_codon:yes stop_codon:yes gene_type:complete
MDINNCSSLDVTHSIYDDTNSFLRALFIGVGVVITGTSLATCIVAQKLFHKVGKEYKQMYGYDSDDEDIFETRYLQEYTSLENKDVNTFSDIKDKTIIESTPDGLVFMGYDKDKEGFFYYSDNKNIKYHYLEVVARKFVIEYDCKKLLYNTSEEIMKSLSQYMENKNKSDEPNNTNVFAKLKSSEPNKKASIDYQLKVIDKEIPVPENSNNYFYKGKICDYEKDKEREVNQDIQNKKNDVEEFETIDYLSFKNK